MTKFNKVSKIPYEVADARNVTDIKSKRNIITVTYDVSHPFADEDTLLTITKVISISYPKKIKSFEVQVDEDDNLYIGIIYKPPFNIFGWTFVKDFNDTHPDTTINIQ
jgi:hypothetical protein